MLNMKIPQLFGMIEYILIIDCFLFHGSKVIFYKGSRNGLIVKSPTLRTDPKTLTKKS